jgi:hypothetical protein
MRFMLLLKGDPPSDPEDRAIPPGAPGELIDAMLRYNEELAKAGVLLAAEGLHPTVTGARVVYSNGTRRVIDGPFAEAKEVIAGFYIIQVRSRDEAIEWAKRCPVDVAVTGDQEAVIEIRQVAQLDELPTTKDQRAADRRVRDQLAP